MTAGRSTNVRLFRGLAALFFASCAAPQAPAVHLVPIPIPAPRPAPPPGPTLCTFDVKGATRFVLSAPCTKKDDLERCVGPASLVVREGDAEVQRIPLERVCPQGDDEQPGPLVRGDFDFDGREDFAVQTGEDGSYGGPSYDVFLRDAAGKFVRSEALSRITHETLGLFQVDVAHERLITFGKSGCCWHVTETLAVENGVPKPVARDVEDATDDAVVVETHERLVGGVWRKTVVRHPR